ncbi:hypothetical protein BDN70DRAFT_883015 [Pholiota conissans]|uniref:Uncharacterized protein n=1 Tax=Pholiota conissans TaxID=109636 RepID=A0A9P6CWU4_9AGAR|nr:hypothetical protein BDN70DRAFT_883015 [Pholiota conissans]
MQALDVHRPSPVRGQLEPYDPRTPKGCRYIQTTDTPDELKVLLPPATAAMYEQLLKLETHELSRKSISWERIMEIRHLKDRMLRKCQKLAKSNTTFPIARMAATPRGGGGSSTDAFVFQTFVAPADFRVKEMEKWFREQQRRNNTAMTAALSSARRPVAAIEAAPGFEMTLVSGPSRQSSKYTLQRSVTNPEPVRQRQQVIRPVPMIQPSRLVQSEQGVSASGVSASGIFSPPPLPILLPSQREEYGLGLSEAASQLNLNSEPVPETQPHEAGPSASPLAPVPDTPTLRPSLSRRNSALRELKTVSWADDPAIDLEGQFKKYASAAKEAQASGKFDEVRLLYLDQIAGLESLHNQVKEGLDHLRDETEHLQRIDDAIRRQRGALDATFQELEGKRALFQEKVQEALTEANEALSRQGLAPKRDLDPIHET